MTALLNWRLWLVVGLVASFALIGAGSYRSGKRNVQAKWDAEKVVQLANAAQDEAENRRKESKRQTEVINAQNAQVKRTTILQTDAASSRAVVDSLRDDIRTATASLPSRSAFATSQYATTSSQLFLECSAAYSAVAATAQGHANDALMLEQAWPK